ncbi:hypothetical protein HX747_22670 [Streptomyces sp. L06]|nr:hypothetical protein [Streptomyces sp. L06]
MPDLAVHEDLPALGQRYEQHNHGSGQSIQGVKVSVHNNWNGEYVRELTVPDEDFAACTDARYVPPRDIGRLTEAERRLARYGVVVLTAPPGSGRRTTALRLLATTVLEPSVPPCTCSTSNPSGPRSVWASCPRCRVTAICWT